MGLSFRPAATEDAPFLRELHHRAYRDVVVRQFGVWDEVAQDRWFDEGLAAARFSVVERAGEPIGAVGTNEQDGVIFLAELQILPELQGHGLGTEVLRVVLERAMQTNQRILLRVLLQSRARSLYERHGFAMTGQTETHYLMEWRTP